MPKFESAKFSNNAILISNAIRNNNDEFDDKTQKFLRQFRDNLNETLVVEVLKLIQNPELGVKFFIWAGRQIGYGHTAPVYNALLELLECGNKRVAEHFLQEIKGDDREVLRKLVNVLIRKYCRNGLWNVALEELGRLKDFGYKPTQATYNALVQVFLEADKLDTAHLVHVEMLDSGFKMDEYTFGSFVHALCKAGRWKEALALVEKEEFVPNTILYTKMISGLCEASLFEEAMDFLNRMRCDSCIPNVMTYRILLCGCLKGLLKLTSGMKLFNYQIAFATWISIGICKKRHLTEISVFSRPSLFVTHAPSDDSLDLVTWLTVLLRSGPRISVRVRVQAYAT